MSLLDLFLDRTGPFGVSRDVYWAFITAVLIGGIVPFVWSKWEKRKWKRLRAHFGVMLSWNHGELGACLQKKSSTQDIFEKIQGEIGLYSSLAASDSRLASRVGRYVNAVNDLWWWIDWHGGSRENMPPRLKEAKYEDLLQRVNDGYVATARALGTEKEFQRPWSKWWKRPVSPGAPSSKPESARTV